MLGSRVVYATTAFRLLILPLLLYAIFRVIGFDSLVVNYPLSEIRTRHHPHHRNHIHQHLAICADHPFGGTVAVGAQHLTPY